MHSLKDLGGILPTELPYALWSRRVLFGKITEGINLVPKASSR